jgi:hypothetical protein
VIEIRSYRRVFDLERRIYSVDRLRLNPAGVPVRGVVYFLAAVNFALLLTAMPVLGVAVKAIPWYLRDLIAPAGVASVLSVIRVDGRTFHIAARGVVGMLATPRTISGLTTASAVGTRWTVPELLLLPDGSDAGLRRMSYRGPGAALVQVEHRRHGVAERGQVGVAGRRATLRISGPARGRRLSRGQVIALEQGGRLLVVPLSDETAG